MDVFYSIKRNGKYLQDVVVNCDYNSTITAPTMGARHTYTEYTTCWGTEQKQFERLTAANYLKTLFEEYRWGSKKPSEIRIIPIIK